MSIINQITRLLTEGKAGGGSMPIEIEQVIVKYIETHNNNNKIISLLSLYPSNKMMNNEWKRIEMMNLKELRQEGYFVSKSQGKNYEGFSANTNDKLSFCNGKGSGKNGALIKEDLQKNGMIEYYNCNIDKKIQKLISDLRANGRWINKKTMKILDSDDQLRADHTQRLNIEYDNIIAPTVNTFVENMRALGYGDTFSSDAELNGAVWGFRQEYRNRSENSFATRMKKDYGKLAVGVGISNYVRSRKWKGLYKYTDTTDWVDGTSIYPMSNIYRRWNYVNPNINKVYNKNGILDTKEKDFRYAHKYSDVMTRRGIPIPPNPRNVDYRSCPTMTWGNDENTEWGWGETPEFTSLEPHYTFGRYDDFEWA